MSFIDVNVYHHIRFDDPRIAALDHKLDLVIGLLTGVKDAMGDLDNKLDALNTDVAASLASIQDSLNNIAADEAGLQAQIAAIGTVTPAQQAKLDAVSAGLKAMAAKVKLVADAVADVTVPVTPPVDPPIEQP